MLLDIHKYDALCLGANPTILSYVQYHISVVKIYSVNSSRVRFGTLAL
jgi:hypothetical protein